MARRELFMLWNWKRCQRRFHFSVLSPTRTTHILTCILVQCMYYIPFMSINLFALHRQRIPFHLQPSFQSKWIFASEFWIDYEAVSAAVIITTTQQQYTISFNTELMGASHATLRQIHKSHSAKRIICLWLRIRDLRML